MREVWGLVALIIGLNPSLAGTTSPTALPRLRLAANTRLNPSLAGTTSPTGGKTFFTLISKSLNPSLAGTTSPTFKHMSEDEKLIQS